MGLACASSASRGSRPARVLVSRTYTHKLVLTPGTWWNRWAWNVFRKYTLKLVWYEVL